MLGQKTNLMRLGQGPILSMAPSQDRAQKVADLLEIDMPNGMSLVERNVWDASRAEWPLTFYVAPSPFVVNPFFALVWDDQIVELGQTYTGAGVVVTVDDAGGKVLSLWSDKAVRVTREP